MIETIAAQVESLRMNLSTLKRDLASLNEQVRSRAEVDALVRGQVAAWRAQASAAVASDLERMAAGQAVGLLSVRTPAGMLDLGPWMTVSMGEASMVKWLASLTQALPEGFDPTERAARAAAIHAEIASIEQDEERLMREAEDLGYPLDPRPDADPRVALEIRE